MTIELHDAVNGDGLFDVLGKAFNVVGVLNTARLTTIQQEVDDFVSQFKKITSPSMDLESAMSGVPNSIAAWKQSGATLTQQIVQSCQRILIEYVAADAAQPSKSLVTALAYLIRQMEADGDYVDPNVVAVSLAAGGDNVGDVAIAYTHLRGDGQVQQNTLAEVMDVSVASAGTAPSLRIQGKQAASGPVREDWPAGSAANITLAATRAGESLLTNGNFESTTIENLPDNWLVGVGQVGVDLQVTNPEIQTVTISGTPSGGSYLILWTNAAGITRSTAPLAYDASGATVQAALAALPGLETVTVATTGTSPDYAHAITFTGLAGNVGVLQSVNHLTGGTSPTIAHATTQNGDDGAYLGRALRIVGNGVAKPVLYHAITLQPETVYFCHFRARRSGTSSPGEEIRVEIVDGFGGSVTQDSAGNNNALAIDATTIPSAGHGSYFFAFRLDQDTTQPVYLRINVTGAITDANSVYLDEVAVVSGQQIYPGGPYVAAFAGATACILDDTWTLTATNNRAGLLQEWFHRVFDMAGKGLLLPTSGAGDLIPDSLVG